MCWVRWQKEALNEVRKMSEDVSVGLQGICAPCRFAMRIPSDGFNPEIAVTHWARISNTSSLSRVKSFPLPFSPLPPHMHTYSSGRFFSLWIDHLPKVGRKKKKERKKPGDISEVKLASWQLIYEVLKSIFEAVIYLKALSLNKQRAPHPNYSYSRNNPIA